MGAFRFGAGPGKFILAFFRETASERIVSIFDAVVFFEAVAAGRIAALPFGCFVGKDVVGGVEGEGMTQRVGENKLFKYTIRRQYNT